MKYYIDNDVDIWAYVIGSMLMIIGLTITYGLGGSLIGIGAFTVASGFVVSKK